MPHFLRLVIEDTTKSSIANNLYDITLVSPIYRLCILAYGLPYMSWSYINDLWNSRVHFQKNLLRKSFYDG